MRRSAPVIFLVLLITGCMASSSNMATTASMDAENYIRSAGPRFIRAFNAGDAAAVTAFYADDAVFLAPNADIVVGTTAIRGAQSSFLTSMHPTLSFTPDRIVQSCDLAYEYGHYSMQMAPSGGNAMNDKGSYVTVWRRMANGDWKIAADSVATSMPMPGMK